ncbi:MAG: HD domain-containing protein [Deltaproteobacteria bacterium]|nr:MAG: HD domain-containing protein [Deltaproteobacteria bacterium]
MNPIEIITRYYEKDSRAYKILITHGRQVADKALEIAGRVAHLKSDLRFIEEAAYLHDIGIFRTHSPELGCFGKDPYVRHGYLGRKILEKIGLSAHGLVCERHVGVGMTQEDIRQQDLPLPARDMLPVSIEEQIICYADKFFSKNGRDTAREKTVAEIIGTLNRYGHDKVRRFQAWVEMFEDVED